jgi:sulfur carrier protein
VITIHLNGAERTLAPNTPLSTLLAELQVGATGTAVAVNRSVIPRAKHDELILQEGDRVEVIRAVGGG